MPITVGGTQITFNDATTQSTAAVNPIPAGTVMLFYQNAAPTGWTLVTTQNNKALRVVSSAGGVAGGTTAFTTVFANQAPTTGATTLSTSQMPSHTHTWGPLIVASGEGPNSGLSNSQSTNGPTDGTTGGAGGGGSHTHTGGTVTLNVQYIDIILCSKN
jgi:hypothetical protein